MPTSILYHFLNPTIPFDFAKLQLSPSSFHESQRSVSQGPYLHHEKNENKQGERLELVHLKRDISSEVKRAPSAAALKRDVSFAAYSIS